MTPGNHARKTSLTPINDLVLARMKTYSARPGKLSSFAKNNKRATVHFFRSNNSGPVDVCEIVPFEQCYDAIRLLLLRKVGPFHKAIREIETILEVLDNMSLLKEIGSLK